MLIRKENLQMDEAKAKLIVCMNWIEIETRFVFFPIQYAVFLIAYQFLGDARVTRSRQCKQHNKLTDIVPCLQVLHKVFGVGLNAVGPAFSRLAKNTMPFVFGIWPLMSSSVDKNQRLTNVHC